MNPLLSRIIGGPSALFVALAIVASHPTGSPAADAPTPKRPYDEIVPAAKIPLSEVSDEDLAYYFAIRWFSNRDYFRANRWFGIQTFQNPLDVWITQEIIYEVEPEVIIETGTYNGGSALLWASILQQIDRDGLILTVDIEDRTRKASQHRLWKRRVKFFHGSSTDPAIVRQLEPLIEGKRVLVILDSLHTPEHVQAELEIYSKFIPVGSYVIVQDTGIVKPFKAPNTGTEGIEAFLAATDEFEVDRSRERFRLTNNPGGYLKRVK
ncbi:MAG: class I SAM-dependent methyltransferase [Myxococcales bacterium]|nr:class I SAM-dependent methyltransferase [Myxococcales bacterium]